MKTTLDTFSKNKLNLYGKERRPRDSITFGGIISEKCCLPTFNKALVLLVVVEKMVPQWLLNRHRANC